MVPRMPNSRAVHLLTLAVVLASLTGCSSGPKPEHAPTNTTVPPVAVEPPPPPEPASALGTASGTLRMVDFAQQDDFWAYDKDPSDANRAKAQGQVDDEFHSAMAVWKPRSQSVVIFLFTDNLSVDEAAQLKESIATNSDVMTNGEAIHKRNLTPGKVAFITVTFGSRPPTTGAQTAHITVEGRGSSGRSYSATGPAEVQVTSLPVNATWAKPGRLLPEIILRTKGKTHYGGSTFGGAEWQIETRVPMIITSGF
jgi:hypothetical protein